MSTESDSPPLSALRIGEWTLVPELRCLQRGQEECRLEPKGVALLLLLALEAPRVVSRAEIFDRVWEGRAVVDGALSRSISLLRRALGDDPQAPRYIETIPRKGYRLIAAVTTEAEPTSIAARGRVAAFPTAEGRESGSAISPRFRVATWAMVGLVSILLMAWAMGSTRSGNSIPDSASSRNGSSLASPVRLAVLPFDNLTGDPADQYLADGLTEELIHQLSRLSALRVVSRASVIAVGAADHGSPEIARRLKVDYLLEGSVLAVGKRLRITAQLVLTPEDEHAWSKTYDRPMTDVLSLHREVARDVTVLVAAELPDARAAILPAAPPVDSEAYRDYLKARFHLNRRTPRDVTQALAGLSSAVERDPGLAMAWAALAEAHILSQLYSKVPQAEAYGAAQTSIERALELDSDLATAHVSLGLLRFLRDWDRAGAEAAYRRALEIEPSFALAHQWLSELLSTSGRHDEALKSVRRAVELDPLSPLVHAAWGQRLNAAGRHAEALEKFTTADDLGATFQWHLRETAYAHHRLGDEAAALEAHLDHMRRREVPGLEALIEAVEAEGSAGFWQWQLERLASSSGSEPMLIAEAYAGLGQHENALPWLENAVAERGGWFFHISKSPAFDTLRQDPRFRRLLGEAGQGH